MAAAMQTPDATGTQKTWDLDPVLTVEHLTMRFGGLVAINNLSFNVGRGIGHLGVANDIHDFGLGAFGCESRG